MIRIGVSLSGIERSLLNRLAEANAGAVLSSLRLSSGSKINSPGDDPSAFVALSGLQSRLCAARAAMSNVTAASNMLTQVQSALEGIRTELQSIRTELLKDEDRGLTAQQRAEAQANVDAAIAQVTALAAAEIGGRRLLDGSADFHVSGRNSDQVADLRAYSTGGVPLVISGSITQAATQAELVYAGESGSTVADDAVFTLTGSLGSAEITVEDGEPLGDVAGRINDSSHRTGVTASVDGNDLILTSVDYGSNATLAAAAIDGTFEVTGGNGDGTAAGTDLSGWIGGLAVTGNGNRVTVARNYVRYTVEFVGGATGTFDPITVDGGALDFALSADLGHRATLAVPSLMPGRLGGQSGSLAQLATGGSLAGLDGNASQAIRVVDEALADLSRAEGAVDGFYNASVTSASILLADLEDNLQDAVNSIDQVDGEEETQRLADCLDLASNASASLAILRQQQFGIVQLVRQIAGLL